MNISGASAWSDLQSSLTSSVTVDYRGEQIPLSSARNLAYDKDPAVRRAAYEAELAAYPKIRDAVAFALCSIKLQTISECELRGYASPLDKALYGARMKRETLDALLSAMEEYLPVFRKYLRAKAKALGHEGGLPFYDLFAPMGKTDRVFTVEDAKEYLLAIFSDFDAELAEMVKTAFEECWIDFYPREGKVGGAFDCGVPSAKQSRVLTNFDGSHSDVVTLAHELGHSFHDRQVFKNSPLNQDYSMPLAETASTFNEVLVTSCALARAESADEKLALIEGELSDACQIICDIYSRYTFEASVIEHRKEEFMDADRLCELMIEAQKKAYGNGLDEHFMHPYMWVCKSHYYSGSLSFYNFPYAFGGLFARGLYAKYKKEGATFVETYKRMLRETALSDVEDCARVAGIDLTKREFWCEGLATIAEKIEEFCRLVEA
jgi:pepF/M3 family oligoendopeptidase